MTPIARDYLDKAEDDLDDARKTLAIGLPKVAARSAYYAIFHAAEAYIFEKLGKAVKTHSGVRAELARTLRILPDAGKPLLTFLGRAYRYKEISERLPDRRRRCGNRGGSRKRCRGSDALGGSNRRVAQPVNSSYPSA